MTVSAESSSSSFFLTSAPNHSIEFDNEKAAISEPKKRITAAEKRQLKKQKEKGFAEGEESKEKEEMIERSKERSKEKNEKKEQKVKAKMLEAPAKQPTKRKGNKKRAKYEDQDEEDRLLAQEMYGIKAPVEAWSEVKEGTENGAPEIVTAEEPVLEGTAE